MRHKKIVTGFLCGIVLVSTIIRVSAAPITSYTVNRSWSTDCVSYTEADTPDQVWKETSSATISIGMDIEAYADIESGETVTFTSNIDTGREDSLVDTIEWYVNDRKVQTTTISPTKVAESTFKLTYTMPTTVYCAYGGTQDGTDSDGTRRYAEFYGLSSRILSVGKGSSTAPMGSRWAWTKATDGESSSFTAPQHGTYELSVKAADGTSIEKEVQLKAGVSYDIVFGADGSTSFGGTKASATNPGSMEPVIKLKLKAIQVVIEKEPGDITANEGTTATVSVTANGGGEPLTYQWYRIPVDGETGTAIEGATAATYLLPTELNQNGTSIYCVVSNGQTEATTKESPVRICTAPQEAPVIQAWNGDGKLIEATTWAKGVSNIKISTGGTIEGAGELKLRYSLDDGTTWAEADPVGVEIPWDGTQMVDLPIIAEAYNSLSPQLKKETILRIHMDDTGPVITVKDNPTTWTNQDVIITVDTEDAGCGVVGEAYSWDEGQTWVRKNTVTVTENKTFKVFVRDVIGNISTAEIAVTKIDKTEPKLEVTGAPGLWQKTNATLTANASDGQSGLAADKPYSWDGGKTWTNESTHEVDINQTLKVQVKDKAGNIKEEVVEVAKLDKEGPVVEVTGNPVEWQKDSVTLTINAEDKGIVSLNSSPYSWNGGTNWVSDKQKTFPSNQTVTVVVRDALGNITETVVEINRIDKDDPNEFTISGVPEKYTNSEVKLSITDASDPTSGLADKAYNWNNEGWTDSNTYTVKGNQDVTVSVRDKAGNERVKSVTIEKIDTTAPTITSITGIPEAWQNTPAMVTVAAADEASGLAEKPYSFNDGKTWQSSPTATFGSNQAVGLKVMDAAGNIAYQPFLIKNVDAEAPEITVSYLNASQDAKSVIVGLYGTDAVSKTLLYCFDYQTEYPEFNIWTSENQQAMAAGVKKVVACKDEMGNIGTTEITPNIYDIGMNLQFPLFAEDSRTCSIAGYTFGPVDGSGNGVYLDNGGNRKEYQTYQVDGKTLTGLAVDIKGKPLGGGVLTGSAKVNGVTFPIYWDNANTQTSTRVGGIGRFFIEPTQFRASAKTSTVQIMLQEYEDETLTKLVNTDVMSCGIIIDISAPIIGLELDDEEKILRVDVKDAISGIASLKYRIKDRSGTGSWSDYTGAIGLTTSSTVEVLCVDRVGNSRITESKQLSVPTTFRESSKEKKEEIFYYRTNMFEHYLFGTGKTSLTSPPDD